MVRVLHVHNYVVLPWDSIIRICIFRAVNGAILKRSTKTIAISFCYTKIGKKGKKFVGYTRRKTDENSIQNVKWWNQTFVPTLSCLEKSPINNTFHFIYAFSETRATIKIHILCIHLRVCEIMMNTLSNKYDLFDCHSVVFPIHIMDRTMFDKLPLALVIHTWTFSRCAARTLRFSSLTIRSSFFLLLRHHHLFALQILKICANTILNKNEFSLNIT